MAAFDFIANDVISVKDGMCTNLTLPADAGQRGGSRCPDAKLSSDPRESAHGLVYLVNHDYCR